MAYDEDTTEPGAHALTTAPLPRPENPRLLGQILMRITGLSEVQLDAALRMQEEEGGRLGELLVRARAVSEDDVLRALGVQLDLPMRAELKIEECDAELAASVPINFAKQHRMMPIRRLAPGAADHPGGRVEVAVADPLDVHALDDVGRVLAA